jgi:hypothetical protein
LKSKKNIIFNIKVVSIVFLTSADPIKNILTLKFTKIVDVWGVRNRQPNRWDELIRVQNIQFNIITNLVSISFTYKKENCVG